jgi:rubrerythrin
VQVLKDQAFSEITLALAEETEAHSDDELMQEDEQVYHVMVKEGRSKKVKTFFRMLDEQRRHANRRKKNYLQSAVTE